MNDSSIQTGDDGTVHLGGEMNFMSTPGIYRELENRFTDSGSVLNIDLSGINHSDSSGLALLLEWQAMVNRLDQQLHITNAPENLLRLAKLCEADKLMDISGREYPDNESI
jgi:phospholipid transport system transporter-binding protein